MLNFELILEQSLTRNNANIPRWNDMDSLFNPAWMEICGQLMISARRLLPFG